MGKVAFEKQTQEGDAGIVEQHVNRANLVVDLLGKVLHCRLAGNVDSINLARNAERLHFRFDGLQRREMDIRRDDVRTTLGKRERRCAADTGTGAGNQHMLIFSNRE